MLCKNISVNAVANCMLVKHADADIHTRESQNIIWDRVSSWKYKLSVSQMSAVLTHHHLS